MVRPEDDFELPVFDRPMEDPPSRVPHEVAVRAFEEIIVALKLRENTPRLAEDISEFKMWRSTALPQTGSRPI